MYLSVPHAYLLYGEVYSSLYLKPQLHAAGYSSAFWMR